MRPLGRRHSDNRKPFAMRSFGMRFAAFATASLLTCRVVAQVDPIIIRGAKFFYKTNGTELYVQNPSITRLLVRRIELLRHHQLRPREAPLETKDGQECPLSISRAELEKLQSHSIASGARETFFTRRRLLLVANADCLIASSKVWHTNRALPPVLLTQTTSTRSPLLQAAHEIYHTFWVWA